jgi:hypothetical protein
MSTFVCVYNVNTVTRFVNELRLIFFFSKCTKRRDVTKILIYTHNAFFFFKVCCLVLNLRHFEWFFFSKWAATQHSLITRFMVFSLLCRYLYIPHKSSKIWYYGTKTHRGLCRKKIRIGTAASEKIIITCMYFFNVIFLFLLHMLL